MATKKASEATTDGGALTKGGAGAETLISPASIEPAAEFAPSGAPVQSVPDVDPANPAVDANPRAGTTSDQNRIDFNDPRKPGHEVVAEQLGYGEPKADKA